MEIEYIYENGDTSLFDGSRQRVSVIKCPYCKFIYDEEIENKVIYWYNTEEKVIQIVMQHLFCHRDGVIILSRCVNCGNISWIHLSFESVLYSISKFGIIDKEKIEDEMKLRIIFAKREWEDSVCINCVNLIHTNEVTHPRLSKYGVWIDCIYEGCTRSGKPLKICKNFRR